MTELLLICNEKDSALRRSQSSCIPVRFHPIPSDPCLQRITNPLDIHGWVSENVARQGIIHLEPHLSIGNGPQRCTEGNGRIQNQILIFLRLFCVEGVNRRLALSELKISGSQILRS